MNCDWTKENVVLYIYGELADDAKFEFEQHIRHCLGCRRELDAALEFKESMAALPVKDVSPNLLAANRMELQESLEHAAQSRNIFSSFIFDLTGWMHQIKLAPALTAALLMIGFAGGVGTTYRMMDHNRGPEVTDNRGPQPPDVASIAGIESITPEANSNQVQIKYNTLQPRTLNGSTDDPQIKQLLLLAARNNRNSGVVLDSVKADSSVRAALTVLAERDSNKFIREESKRYLASTPHLD